MSNANARRRVAECLTENPLSEHRIEKIRQELGDRRAADGSLMSEDAFQKTFLTKSKTDTVLSIGENNANNTAATSTANATSAVTSTDNAGNREATSTDNAKSIQSENSSSGRSELDVANVGVESIKETATKHLRQ